MNKSKDYRARMKNSWPSIKKTYYILEKWLYSLFEKESCILNSINHALASLPYPSSDSFHFRLLAVRGELESGTPFFIRAFKNSFLVFILLANLLREILTANQ